MRIILCGAIIGIGLAAIWYVWYSSKPNLLRNEANGPTNVRRFSGYKESLKTRINQGTPIYGEAVSGWTTGTFRSTAS